MKSFLEIVASDIICRYGTQLNRIAVVFPNKRASLFLNDALARIAQMPIWQYGIQSINFKNSLPLRRPIIHGIPLRSVHELVICNHVNKFLRFCRRFL